MVAVLALLQTTAMMSVYAQSADPTDKTINLELDQAELRMALTLLFTQAGVNYQIAPDVQGTVTIHLKNTPFLTALRTICKAHNLVFTDEGGVYTVKVKEAETDVPLVNTTTTDNQTQEQEKQWQKIYLNTADPAAVVALFGGTAIYPETLLGGNGSGYGGNNSSGSNSGSSSWGGGNNNSSSGSNSSWGGSNSGSNNRSSGSSSGGSSRFGGSGGGGGSRSW